MWLRKQKTVSPALMRNTPWGERQNGAEVFSGFRGTPPPDRPSPSPPPCYLLDSGEPIARDVVPAYISVQGSEADEPIAPIFHWNPKQRAALSRMIESSSENHAE